MKQLALTEPAGSLLLGPARKSDLSMSMATRCDRQLGACRALSAMSLQALATSWLQLLPTDFMKQLARTGAVSASCALGLSTREWLPAGQSMTGTEAASAKADN